VNPPLAYRQFGSQRGRIVVYFHGAPGAPGEAALFDSLGKEHGLNFVCFDRFTLNRSLEGEAYFRALAEAISGMAFGTSVDLIGFSIGAFVALQTSRHLGDRVYSLHLVSAAAPLEVSVITQFDGAVFKLSDGRKAITRSESGWPVFSSGQIVIASKGSIRIVGNAAEGIVGVDLAAIMVLEGPQDLIEQIVDGDHGLIGEMIRQGDFKPALLPGKRGVVGADHERGLLFWGLRVGWAKTSR
jgi:pimeloyl-ACP methyl ester carboxylesterase